MRHRLIAIFRPMLWAVFLIQLSAPLHAALTIEIIGGGEKQTPVAVVPFAAEAALPQSITAVVSTDLARSGLFRLVDTQDVNPLPHEPGEVNYATWKSKGAEAIAIGSVIVQPDGRLEVRFRLMDAVKQTQLAGFTYSISPAQLRVTAHKIADVIYEKLTGDVGVFSTRITYVVKNAGRYELQVADADSFGAQTVLTSKEPIISPAWSPDGNNVAYVSFEARRAVVYVQSLVTGQRRMLAGFKGSNSAPAWSPDGQKLALVLTKDGNSQIYLVNADGSDFQKLTQSYAIDTEPSFSADGQWIIFTSDRGGSPQIYRMPAAGGQAERLTFEGSYNVSPHFSPDGKSFAYVERTGNQFYVAVEDIASHQTQVLSDTGLDETPSFAPNGKIILYASETKGHGVLVAVSTDGRVKQRLSAPAGDVRDPAWGPLPKNQ